MAKTDKEIYEIFSKIDNQPSEELTQEEKESLAMAEAMDDGSSVSLNQYISKNWHKKALR